MDKVISLFLNNITAGKHMKHLEEFIKKADLDFFSSGAHKISIEKALDLQRNGKAIIIDVRTSEEQDITDFTFALKLPLNFLPHKLDSLPKDKLIFLFCVSKVRAAIALSYLISEGFSDVKVIADDIGDIVGIFKTKYVKENYG